MPSQRAASGFWPADPTTQTEDGPTAMPDSRPPDTGSGPGTEATDGEGDAVPGESALTTPVSPARARVAFRFTVCSPS
ncbi:hypothetical protein [Actinomadura harenae]|uniref:Uncharacterized protein n=1 Tax=Actinomadura harenae TaxID=2483351 RepID=A0A3M2MDS7_9ACTN|nr:hypothetical protein [Actinomadura harenae]RMI47874.1 hypothetical protein EBO15_00880 [Actinomadura harenae]